MPDLLPFVVEPMRLADVSEVMAIERVAFTAPWSARAFRYEIADNGQSIMLVARASTPGDWRQRWLARLGWRERTPVLGYGGVWLFTDEAHVSTLAVHPDWRGRGLGENLLLSLLDSGAEQGARRATLEVRVSNRAAQSLYQKYGFKVVSVRKRYYSDNGEDAYIMATPSFDRAEFQAHLRLRRERLFARLTPGDRDAVRTIRAGRAG